MKALKSPQDVHAYRAVVFFQECNLLRRTLIVPALPTLNDLKAPFQIVWQAFRSRKFGRRGIIEMVATH